MTLTQEFQKEVDSFLAMSGMDPTTFGREAMNDPRFVFDIRASRSPSLRTIERVREWIKKQKGGTAPQPQPEKAA